jgi:hypothetical protein
VLASAPRSPWTVVSSVGGCSSDSQPRNSGRQYGEFTGSSVTFLPSSPCRSSAGCGAV